MLHHLQQCRESVLEILHGDPVRVSMVFSILSAAAKAAFIGEDTEEILERRKRAALIEKRRAYAEAIVEAAVNENMAANAKPTKWAKKAAPAPAKKAEPATAKIAEPNPALAAEAAPVGPAPTGNASNGAALFKAKCATCHTVNEGGPNKSGPNLYGVMGRQSGQVTGFSYTSANKSSGVIWNNDSMFEFLANPKKFLKGTNMAFPGFKKEQDRADVTAYLATLK